MLVPRLHPRVLFRLAWIAALAAAVGLVDSPPARSASEDDAQKLMDLNAAATDPARAAGAISEIRQALAGGLDERYGAFARQMLLQALITAKRPPAELVSAADTLAGIAGGSGESIQLTVIYGQVAEALLDRGEGLDQAAVMAKRARAACPKGERFQGVLAAVDVIIGRTELERGNTDAAIAALSGATASPDSANALRYLGQAYEKKGKPDQAIDAYIRSVAVFPTRDTSAAEPLRALYAKRYPEMNDLAARVAAARARARQRIALDERRHERPAPGWTLPNLAGKAVESDAFKGKVVVVDFWGSWCGPCRAELPYFQAAYERHKDRGVAFVGINWEMEKTPAARVNAAKRFMEQGGYTFPVVLDHDRSAVQSYEIQAFPTLFLIDRSGQIRYRNVGLSDGIEEILEAQIESLLAEGAR